MQNLLLLRNAIGITQAELANRLDISQGYLSEIETGKKTNLGLPLLKTLVSELRTTPQWLRLGKGFSFNPENHIEYISFFGKQIKNANKIIFITVNNQNPVGYLFAKKDGTIMSMNGKVGESNTKDYIYLNIFDTYYYRKILMLLAANKIEPEIVFFENNSVEILHDINLENLVSDAKKINDFIKTELFKIERFENKISTLLFSGITDEELLLLETIKDFDIDIFDILKYVKTHAK